jgi:hypothetical protein
MRIPAHAKTAVPDSTAKRLAMVAGLFVAACVLGSAVITAGAGSNAQTVAAGTLVLLLLGGVIAFAMDVPLMGPLRFVFIASFFFKADVNLLKVNELEDPSGLNISLTLLIALVLFIYDQIIDEEKDRVLPPAFSILFLLLLLSSAISVLYAGATLLGGFSVFSLFSSILIAYVTASHFSRRDRLVQLVTGLGAGLVFTGLVALTQYIFEFPTNLAYFGTGTEDELLGTQSQLLSRVPAFLRTPTEMAWVVTSLIPVVLAPVICRVKGLDPRRKMLLWAATPAGIVSVILSLARGSWIGLVTVMALLIGLGWYKLSAGERNRYFRTVFATAILLCIVLSPFAGRIYDRLVQDDQGSAQIRVPLMETALRMIEDNPAVGVGLNGYRTNMTRYDETGMFVSQVFPNPVHNIFAHIIAEVGIIGGALFCLLIVFSLFESFRSMGSDDRLLAALSLGLGLGMIAFIISGTKEPGSLGSARPPMRMCFFLFGAILAISRMRRRTVFHA